MNRYHILIQRAAQVRPFASQPIRRPSKLARLIIEWRLAELKKINPPPGTNFAPLVQEYIEAMDTLREIADSLIKRGHP